MQIQGKNSVFEALNSNTNIEKIVVNDNGDAVILKILNLAKDKKVKIQYSNKAGLDRLSPEIKHQNIIAYVNDFQYCDIDDILNKATSEGHSPFIILLDGLEDPHNFGSIIRVCECGGVDGIIIPKNRSVNVSDTVIRTSAGAINHTLICKVTNLNDTIRYLKGKGIWVMAVELGGLNIYQQDLTGPLALVIGGEGKGVSRLTRENCDIVLTLPMKGKVNSLNASVAAGIAVFEANRQRG